MLPASETACLGLPVMVAGVWKYAIQSSFRVSDERRDATGDKVMKH